MTKADRELLAKPETQELLRQVGKILSTDEGMARWMDDLFGAGNWDYDADEDVWVTPDTNYPEEGARAFLVVKRGGDWFRAVVPEATFS